MIFVPLWLKTTTTLSFKEDIKMVAHGNKITAQNSEILIQLDIKAVVVTSFVQANNVSLTGKTLPWQIKSSLKNKINYAIYVEPL